MGNYFQVHLAALAIEGELVGILCVCEVEWGNVGAWLLFIFAQQADSQLVAQAVSCSHHHLVCGGLKFVTFLNTSAAVSPVKFFGERIDDVCLVIKLLLGVNDRVL